LQLITYIFLNLCKVCSMPQSKSSHNTKLYFDLTQAAFFSFRNYEQAIIACKELGDLRDVTMLAQKSCHMYQQHGSCDSGAAVLDKGAKILESQFPEQALQLYQQAIEVVMVNTSYYVSFSNTSDVYGNSSSKITPGKGLSMPARLPG
jgi:hypothetical protein